MCAVLCAGACLALFPVLSAALNLMPGSALTPASAAALTLAPSAALTPAPAAAQTPSLASIRLSPALPAAGDALRIAVDLVSPFPLSAAPAVVRGDGSILLDVRQDLSHPSTARLQTVTFEVAGLAPPGNYLLVATLDGAPSSTFAFTLRPRTSLLDLLGARFLVAVDRPGAGAAPSAVRLSDASGYFWFYDPANPELTVKILDGRAVNGHFWVFIASMTDGAQTVTVTDLGGGCHPASSCPSRSYVTPPHANRNFVDVEAFGGPDQVATELSFRDLVVISPALPGRLDPVRVVIDGLGEIAADFAPPAIAGGSITLVGVTPGGRPAPDAPGRWTRTVELGALDPGSYTLEVILDGFEYLTQSFQVHEAVPGLALAGGHFLVAAARPPSPAARAGPGGANPESPSAGRAAAGRSAPGGAAAGAPLLAAAPVEVSDAAGYFWFFDGSDLELTVKVLDGRPVNGHFWVFIASMTDQPYTVTVTDLSGTCAAAQAPPPVPAVLATPAAPANPAASENLAPPVVPGFPALSAAAGPAAPSRCSRTYTNPAHSNQNFIDTAAF
jgi:hypothetical protein